MLWIWRDARRNATSVQCIILDVLDDQHCSAVILPLAHSVDLWVSSSHHQTMRQPNNLYPADHGSTPADTSKAPCHPRSLKPLSQSSTLTASARASIPHSTNRSPLWETLSVKAVVVASKADVRVEPMEVVPLLDVVHDPVRRDAFPCTPFPQDPLVVLVYCVRAESSYDNKYTRLQ